MGGFLPNRVVVTFIIMMDLRLFFESKRNCGSALLMCRILCRFTSGSLIKVPLNCCDDDMRERILFGEKKMNFPG